MSKNERDTSFNKNGCLVFVSRLWDLDKLGMFHHPVSAEELPDYHTVIKRPVDLSSIRDGIEKGTYATDVDVQNDVARMITNALEYNAKGSTWYQEAMSFRKTYLDLARQSGLVVDDDEAYIPSRSFKDDESTLRRAEKRNKEDLDEVLRGLEAEKDVPLEELRAKYRRVENITEARGADDVDSSEQGEDEESDEEGSDEEDDDEEDSCASEEVEESEGSDYDSS
ncbi:bromodomain factor 2 protein, putative [Trypanosoma equiperdum]|uniref:Bromo domain-containing protein n=3 Tax=Trypanozoon TaxID=39700 RepID=Q38AM1_TRYB2|nr:hypothetical protein, conserved [Trypanosoma brucei brucei TREU927]EAN78149.1 hypothetical protein, conserved [Trypanosoma brucei brucei TREU927]SCU72608.1 bromodomain factor 2 protein, putative [Trypanosoma equiperdum]